MHRGYIKIWRKIEDSFLMSDPAAVWLWVRLLLKANHAEREFIFNNQKVVIKRGQLITGRKSLVDKHKISESKVFRLLKLFESEQLIEQQKNNRYSIITILNYNDYQHSEQLIEQPVNNQRTTSEQPVNTNNNKETLINTKKNKDAEGSKAPSSVVLKNKKGQDAYDMFCAKYKEVTGAEYIPQWPKDMKLLKPILPHIKSSDHWGRVLDAYFSDPFAQTTKFTFGVLISGINRYNKESHDNIPVG